MQIQKPDPVRIKEISEDIIKSMLDRSYPVVNATHFFKKYSDGNGKPEHQFSHALQMLTEGGILRMDTKKDPFSVTFVLMENGAPKMHHMIDDEYGSETFGQMFNDPYEGDKKRQTCYKHLKEGYTAHCEKCELEKNSMICMDHNTILSDCNKCKKESQVLKKVVAINNKDSAVTAILAEYKKNYWNFEEVNNS